MKMKYIGSSNIQVIVPPGGLEEKLQSVMLPYHTIFAQSSKYISIFRLKAFLSASGYSIQTVHNQ